MTANDFTIYCDGATTVTNSRLIVAGKVFALQSLVSYQICRPSRAIGPAVALMLAAVPLGFLGLAGWVSAAIVAGAGIYMLTRPRPFQLVLTTTNGEVAAVESRDIAGVQNVQAAISQALSM